MYFLFRDQAARHGTRPAVRDEQRTLSYAELADRAEALAGSLRERFGDDDVRIGLYCGRTVDLVVAVLGVSAAGYTYVPLDPAYPESRLDFMAKDSGLAAIVSDRVLPGALAGIDVLRIDGDDRGAAAPPREELPEPSPESTAYIIYTSGSTGRPKGVAVRRRSVAALVRGVLDQYDFGAQDVWTLLHSYCFDVSVWEMWGALASGATLVVVPSEVVRSPRATIDLMTRHRVTVMSVVPTVFRYLAAHVRTSGHWPSTLRRVVFGGEMVDAADVRIWRATAGNHCEFMNTYGITETTIYVSTRTFTDTELDAAGDERGFAAELGRPIPGWEVAVLDDTGVPVAVGETGEIWVAGIGVAEGYVNRPDLTAERFRMLDVGGGPSRLFYRSGDLAVRAAEETFRIVGRADLQVKINGFRIEPGEVEVALRGIPGVLDAIVTAGTSRRGEPMLTAHYTSESGLSPERLRELFAAEVPAHLVPGAFVRMTDLPRTASGKSDRRALSEELTESRFA
ncbi:amino acid adenylation domain-containing protein [Streptomyces sp. NBC_01239]|uniref:amino acid adenylation domain-containing protein n=1 Tax=Streptomyces sp. NBC_01239 TaxID=2903792 RepID=UPI002251D459|nr:amino acid adenylation domain-containing protein [Streptomyces sp. NBC_01239]MCX4816922.1 amino acid adenylation domain-containing protein [Streptomyces sp. NBC_01239]